MARLALAVTMAAALMLISGGCVGDDSDASESQPSPTAAATAPSDTTPAEPAPPTPTATPSPTPSPTPGSLACDARAPHEEALATAVAETMEGYQGEWGFALVDVACDREVVVNPEHAQYPASAGKIVTIIGALRAVEEGRAAFAGVDGLVRTVFRESLDFESDRLDDIAGRETLPPILEEAGVSEVAYIRDGWRFTNMRPLDMAKVWAALVRGELLSEEHTEYALEVAGTPDIPDLYETFPDGSFDLPGFDYGQKAGYWVSDGLPWHLVGAGFLRSEADPAQAFTAALLILSENPDLGETQRQEVFPHIVEYVRAVTGEDEPLS